MGMFEAMAVAGLVALVLLLAVLFGWGKPKLTHEIVAEVPIDASTLEDGPRLDVVHWSKDAFWREVRNVGRKHKWHRDHDDVLDRFTAQTAYWCAPVFEDGRLIELQVWGEARADSDATIRCSTRHSFAASLAHFAPTGVEPSPEQFCFQLMDAISEIDEKVDAWKRKALAA